MRTKLLAPLLIALLVVLTLAVSITAFVSVHADLDNQRREVVRATGDTINNAVRARAVYLSNLADVVGIQDVVDVKEIMRWVQVRGRGEHAMVSIQWLRRSPSGKLLPSGTADTMLLAPADNANNQLADAASSPVAKAAITTASVRKEVAVSSPVKLASGNAAFYLAVPIDASAAGGKVSKVESQSVMVGLIDAQVLVADALGPRSNSDQALLLQQLDPPMSGHPAEAATVSDGEVVLANVGPAIEDPAFGAVAIQNRTWNLVVTGPKLSAFEAALPWAVLGLGLAFAMLIGIAFHQSGRRRDAAERLAGERSTELANSTAMMERITGSIDECFYTYALDMNGTARIRFATPGWESMLSLPSTMPADGSGVEWSIPVHPEDAERLARARSKLRVGRAVDIEFQIIGAVGEVRWLWAREHPIGREGDQVLVDGVISDINARKGVEHQLAHRATHDPLTELPNRALFLEHLASALDRSKKDESRVAVLFIDVDRFKSINDNLGHDMGDQLLVGMAERLSAAARPRDVVARFGGDEFTILCDSLEAESDAVELAQRLAQVIEVPFDLDGTSVVINASVGIAIGPGDETAAERLLHDADLAMYRAKDLGSGYELFDDALEKRATESFDTEAALRTALARKEITPYYQPVIDLKTGRLVGVEALARWDRTGDGVVAASEFIAVAEKTGLIVPIGRQVFEMACAQLRSWQLTQQEHRPGSKPLWMAWNLSMPELAQSDLAGTVAAILAAYRIEASSLFVEITERVLLDGIDAAVARLNSLRRIGVRLSIDDFGTGYSSLSYLKQLPVDQLKIDRSFIEYLGRDTHDGVIVTAIIDMARTLGIEVVAEGIETPQQLAVLQSLECGYGQGYAFAKPQSGDQLTALLASMADSMDFLSAMEQIEQ